MLMLTLIRQRRIKCDEKRPSCTQCERSHKECVGYPPPPRHAVPYASLRIAPRPMAAPSQPDLAPGPSLLAKETVLLPRRVKRVQQGVQQQSQGTSVTRDSPSSATPPPGQHNLPSPTIYRPSNNVPLHGVEVHYFDIFRAHTASELSGYFDSVFWTQRVLQECHVEPAIRHAAIALGALYKTLEQSSKSPSPTDSATTTPNRADLIMSHWQVAVRQYSEACNAMMLLNGQTQHSNRTRLMSSVLLASFDAFIGDHKQAIIQIQSGLGLMKQLRGEQARGTENVLKSSVEEELVTIFTRLAIQAKSYDLAFHFPEPYVIHLAPEELEAQTADSPYPEQRTSFSIYPSLDIRFADLRDARLAYDRLCEKGLRFVERLYLVKKQPYPLFPASWRQYSMAHQGQIDAWAKSYQPLFESRLTTPGLSAHERNGIATLKMSHTNSKILFLCMFNSTESHFDVFGPQFQQIVDLGQEVVADDERKAVNERCPYPDLCQHRRWSDPPSVLDGGYTANHIKPSFSADLGIVPPLFVVATKCRDPHLRRKAIQLMRSSSRREGMWDSEMSARISQWVMQIEESDGSESQQRAADQQHHQPGMPLKVDTSQGYTAPNNYPQVQFDEQYRTRPIPEEKRIMIHTVDFDLRARFADITAGTRGATVSMDGDRRRRTTHISW